MTGKPNKLHGRRLTADEINRVLNRPNFITVFTRNAKGEATGEMQVSVIVKKYQYRKGWNMFLVVPTDGKGQLWKEFSQIRAQGTAQE